MATRPPLANVPQPQQLNGNGVGLCDHCHQKPKFSNHNYCSKKCASQATTQVALCNYCRKKPKFQNFDFCGKTCASLAQTGGKSQQPNPAQTTSAKVPNTQPPNASRNKPLINPQNGTIDPMQVAKLVIQHIPQLQSLINPLQSQSQPQPVYQQPVISASAPPVTAQVIDNSGRSTTSHPMQSNPIAPGSAGVPLTNTAVQLTAAVSGPVQQKNLNTQCRIPGCGKPVFADANGQSTSEYCSMTHRQEAVSSGLVEPCIMCLDLPQSEMDYFCGRACREEALNKNLIPVRDEV
ncbi:hypothetical protein L218DRAFT_625005 [Marasmius fiardii PR-910]|nr:hypothetical protein L218DRAFT_625005 [Marasmius fiardii PR-910]